MFGWEADFLTLPWVLRGMAEAFFGDGGALCGLTGEPPAFLGDGGILRGLAGAAPAFIGDEDLLGLPLEADVAGDVGARSLDVLLLLPLLLLAFSRLRALRSACIKSSFSTKPAKGMFRALSSRLRSPMDMARISLSSPRSLKAEDRGCSGRVAAPPPELEQFPMAIGDDLFMQLLPLRDYLTPVLYSRLSLCLSVVRN